MSAVGCRCRRSFASFALVLSPGSELPLNFAQRSTVHCSHVRCEQFHFNLVRCVRADRAIARCVRRRQQYARHRSGVCVCVGAVRVFGTSVDGQSHIRHGRRERQTTTREHSENNIIIAARRHHHRQRIAAAVVGHENRYRTKRHALCSRPASRARCSLGAKEPRDAILASTADL